MTREIPTKVLASARAYAVACGETITVIACGRDRWRVTASKAPKLAKGETIARVVESPR